MARVKYTETATVTRESRSLAADKFGFLEGQNIVIVTTLPEAFNNGSQRVLCRYVECFYAGRACLVKVLENGKPRLIEASAILSIEMTE